jgi:hypothetical protein
MPALYHSLPGIAARECRRREPSPAVKHPSAVALFSAKLGTYPDNAFPIGLMTRNKAARRCCAGTGAARSAGFPSIVWSRSSASTHRLRYQDRLPDTSATAAPKAGEDTAMTFRVCPIAGGSAAALPPPSARTFLRRRPVAGQPLRPLKQPEKAGSGVPTFLVRLFRGQRERDQGVADR